jgi:serine/threonine-protein kinase
MGERPLGIETWIDAIATPFDRAWRAGQRPRIEDCLTGINEPRRARLLEELLRVEREHRLRLSENPTLEEYRRRFPDDAAVVDAIFDPAATRPSLGSGASPITSRAPDAARLDLPPDASVLAGLAESIGSVPRVLLRDPQAGPETPVVRPSSTAMPVDTGRYQILGEIGHGGIGAVLKARDPDLGRDLAIKILLPKHHNEPGVTGRFVEEAQISGQLQHPGIVPVHELGRFADARLYFTMKLVKGRTLAALLADRDNPAHDLPRFLGIFQQICQTMAYAHARGVIHRDLKPSNVMVGSFGEVQVMDWGLAKVLTQGGTAGEQRLTEPAVSVIRTQRSSSEAHVSRFGDVMGTPAYMAPEQAGGDVEMVDERADVFGLGSILCEILTGRPAYTGPAADAILRKAWRGDTADALGRLDGCGADAELVALARHCLAAEPEERPRDAGVVARQMTAYLAGVQERLKVAELARAAELARTEEARATAAAAEGRARAERRARRMTVGLAASVLIAGTLGAAGWRWVELDRIRRATAMTNRVNAVLQRATQLRGQAQRAAVGDLAPWVEALAAAKHAGELLETGADSALRRQTEALLATVTAEKQAADAAARSAESDRRLQDTLLDIRSATADDRDGSAAEASYTRAFQEAGIDLTTLPPDKASAHIKARPLPVAASLVAALDDWAAVRRARRHDRAGALRLVAVANAADPDPWRVGLRRALDLADRAARAQALRNLAASTQPDTAPAVDLDLLGTALSQAGEPKAAEDVLRAGRRKFPSDVWLNYDLAQLLEAQSRRDEAIRYYSIARALRPETGHALAHALDHKGESVEAVAVFRDLVVLRPGNGRHWGCYGRLLRKRDDPGSLLALEKAVATLRETVRLKPDDAEAHTNLGLALHSQEKLEEAVAEHREAIRLQPDDAAVHYNLGIALRDQGKLDEAVAAFRTAIRIKPDDDEAHHNLGSALYAQGKLDEAVAALRAAIRIEPDDAWVHYNLGVALRDQGKPDEAIAAFRTAIRIRPNLALGHFNLSALLCDVKHDYDGAIAAFRTGIRITPDEAGAHYNLGVALHAHGKLDPKQAT